MIDANQATRATTQAGILSQPQQDHPAVEQDEHVPQIAAVALERARSSRKEKSLKDRAKKPSKAGVFVRVLKAISRFFKKLFPFCRSSSRKVKADRAENVPSSSVPPQKTLSSLRQRIAGLEKDLAEKGRESDEACEETEALFERSGIDEAMQARIVAKDSYSSFLTEGQTKMVQDALVALGEIGIAQNEMWEELAPLKRELQDMLLKKMQDKRREEADKEWTAAQLAEWRQDRLGDIRLLQEEWQELLAQESEGA